MSYYITNECAEGVPQSFCDVVSPYAIEYSRAAMDEVGWDYRAKSFQGAHATYAQMFQDAIVRATAPKGASPSEMIDSFNRLLALNFSTVPIPPPPQPPPEARKPKAEIGIKFPWYLIPVGAVAGVALVYILVKG